MGLLIYDTLVLVSGIIVAVIALLPVAGIPAATRLWSGAIGGGLILLALYLGSLRSFRYPSMVWGGPLIALLVLGAVVADARRRTNPNQAGLPADQRASGPLPPAPVYPVQPEPLQQPAAPAPAPVVGGVQDEPSPGAVASPDAPGEETERLAAWVQVNDPATTSERLAEIAGSYPEFGPQMLSHPNVYPELRDWIAGLTENR